MSLPVVISPRTVNTVPNTSTSMTCNPEIRSPTAQKALISLLSRRFSLVQSSFCASNFSTSVRSRPKARTTRTPVRFSWAMAESLPSFSSYSKNIFSIFPRKTTE